MKRPDLVTAPLPQSGLVGSSLYNMFAHLSRTKCQHSRQERHGWRSAAQPAICRERHRGGGGRSIMAGANCGWRKSMPGITPTTAPRGKSSNSSASASSKTCSTRRRPPPPVLRPQSARIPRVFKRSLSSFEPAPVGSGPLKQGLASARPIPF